MMVTAVNARFVVWNTSAVPAGMSTTWMANARRALANNRGPYHGFVFCLSRLIADTLPLGSGAPDTPYPLTRIYERRLATNRSSPAPLSEHGIGLDKQEVHPDNAHCSMARHPVQEVDLHSIG